MPSLREQLANARADMEVVRQRIETQTALIERLQSDGHDTGAAEELLATFLGLLGKLSLHQEALERDAEERSRNQN